MAFSDTTDHLNFSLISSELITHDLFKYSERSSFLSSFNLGNPSLISADSRPEWLSLVLSQCVLLCECGTFMYIVVSSLSRVGLAFYAWQLRCRV